MKNSRVIGIDPGFGRLGWGVVELKGRVVCPIAYGCIETPVKMDLGERLLILETKLGKVLADFQPQLAAVEELFFAKNAKTAMGVAQARGVILLTLKKTKVKILEFKPVEVKQAVTGYGRAEKKQVQAMVQKLLGIKKVVKPDDAADALALALAGGTAGRWSKMVQ